MESTPFLADPEGRTRLPDRLFELLVDIHDEGPRTLGEARFYAQRSFLPEQPSPQACARRLRTWLTAAHAHGWIAAADVAWSYVDTWLERAERGVARHPRDQGPELVTTPLWHEAQTSERVRPEGATAWTWPEGWDRSLRD